MTELTLVHLSPTADSSLRWADGSLKGLKMLKWSGGQVLSPHHRTVWPGAVLAAEGWNANEAVRNQGGIHAIWPSRELESAALNEWAGYAPRRGSQFTALVAGWGRSVMGDVGWRAEHVRLKAIISPPKVGYRKLQAWCLEHGVKWSVL